MNDVVVIIGYSLKSGWTGFEYVALQMQCTMLIQTEFRLNEFQHLIGVI